MNWVLDQREVRRVSTVYATWQLPPMPLVLASNGCCNKLPWLGCFWPTEIYPLLVLEVRSLNLGVSRATLPPKALQENPYLFLAASGDAGIPWGLCLHLYTTFFSVCLISFHLALLRLLVMAFSAHLGNPGWSVLKILNVIMSTKTLLPNKPTFTGPGDLDMVVSLGTILPTTPALGIRKKERLSLSSSHLWIWGFYLIL